MARAPAEPDDPADPCAGQSAAVQAGYARLRVQFLAGLPRRWDEIRAAPPGPVRAAALHRLAGAAGSYGLLALGEAARRAESTGGQDETLAALRTLIEAAGVTVR